MKSIAQKLFIAVFLAVISAGIANPQKPAPKVLRAFEPMEELVYDAEFSRALLRK